MTAWDMSDLEMTRDEQPATSSRAKTFGYPVPLAPSPIPWEAQLLIMQLALMVLYPIALGLGRTLYATDALPAAVIGSAPLALTIGTAWYVHRLWKIHVRRSLPSAPEQLPLSYTQLFLATVFGVPLTILLFAAFGAWFSRQLIASGLLALATGALFYYRGEFPVRFAQEYLFANPWAGRAARYDRPRDPATPDLTYLATVLTLTVIGPVFLSVAGTILVLVLYTGWKLHQSFQTLLAYGDFPQVAIYLLFRAKSLLTAYIYYPDVTAADPQAWPPTETRRGRWFTAFVLAGSLCATLFTGLSFFCPWDFFAWLTVPAYSTADSELPRTIDPFGWLVGPFVCLAAATSKTGMFLAFAIAAVLLFVGPPAILLTMYFPRLVDLEQLYQEALRNRKQFA